MGTLICLAVLGILMLYLGFLRNRTVLVPVAIAGLVTAVIIAMVEKNPDAGLFSNMLSIDGFSRAFTVSMLFTTILVFLFAEKFYRRAKFNLAEIYSLTVFSLFGAVIMTSFNNIIMLLMQLLLLLSNARQTVLFSSV